MPTDVYDCPQLPTYWNDLTIMADLTEDQKRAIVEALACFSDVPTIIGMFHKDYGIQLDRKQVGRYDPTRPYYAGGERWREIFEARRRAYLEDLAAVPVAHQGYRLNMLQRGVDAAAKAGNWLLAAKLLEQAAKEVGGAFTNQKNLRFERDCGRLDYRDMTSQERGAALAELLRQGLEKRREQQTATSLKAA